MASVFYSEVMHQNVIDTGEILCLDLSDLHGM